ncbi:MAG: DUF2029 domain-containing protein [Anaerolineae bacterium]|nr:DUF2029 domain-containing protein [Anaerolineae bacterium]
MCAARRSHRWPNPFTPAAALLLVALVARLAWLAYTSYTAEDAFITFRYARNLIAGNGFTYNPGEHIYGTTTPLFTLAMAIWMRLAPDQVVLGARLLSILAALGSFALALAVLRRSGVGRPGGWVALGALAITAKVCVMDTQGMETPVVILFLMAAWYAFTLRRSLWVGVCTGLLLWTRIDLILWIAALVVVEWRTADFKNATRIVWVTGLVYLPWVVFAWLYFGSPIPYTITAKWVAYGTSDSPLSQHLATLVSYLSPFVLRDAAAWIVGGAILIVALWQGFRLRNDRAFLVLPIFALAEIARLVVTRATFFDRYFVPLLWVTWILAAAGLVDGWQRINRRGSLPALLPRLAAAACAVMILGQGVGSANVTRAIQTFRYEASLKAIGIWLNAHAQAHNTVLLEPLGYVGYYANATMLDEVGLVTPRIVDLKRQGVAWDDYFAVLLPDYMVTHCDDALRLAAGQTSHGQRFIDYYAQAAVFNPLRFEPTRDVSETNSNLARSACYEVWRRTG